MNPDTAGRPVLIKGKTQLLFGGMGRLSENCVLNIKNKSHSVTAEIVVPKEGAEGVIVAQGANIGGWSLYAKGGKLKYCYNYGGFKQYFVEGATPIPAGEHQVRMEFAYAGGGLGKGGKVSLYIDGKKVGEGEWRQHWPWSSPPTMVATLARTAARRFRRTTARRATPSTAASRACSSPSPTPRRIRTTWSSRRTPFASRWRGSNRSWGVE